MNELISEWKKYIDKENWEWWENYVTSSFHSMYHWEDCKFACELIKMLYNWSSLEDIEDRIYKWWDSYYAFQYLKEYVVMYSKRGREFEEYINSKFK